MAIAGNAQPPVCAGAVEQSPLPRPHRPTHVQVRLEMA